MRRVFIVAVLLLDACVSVSNVPRPLQPNEIAIGPYHEQSTRNFVGSLMYEGGCLVFNGDNGAQRLLPIWPAGTHLEESLITFHRPAKTDQRIAIAEEIRLDGRPAEWTELDPAIFAPFEHQCGWAQPFFVSGLAPAN